MNNVLSRIDMVGCGSSTLGLIDEATEFTTLLGGVIFARPLGARAQQRVPVVGFLRGRLADDSVWISDAFRHG